MHDIPLGSAINIFTSPHAHLDFVALLLSWAFFEAKMRGLFSMLFGAGVVLLTSRADSRGSRDTADIYARRNLWLLLFGLLHTCFIWEGDILFSYALDALLFLYPFRRLRAKTLLWTGTLLSLFLSTSALNLGSHVFSNLWLHHQVEQVQQRQQSHLPLSASDRKHLAAWDQLTQSHTSSPEKTAKALAEAHEPYWPSVMDRAQGVLDSYFSLKSIFGIFDNVPVMLLGMGLMKIGFFSLELETSAYLWTALIGFSITIPLYTIGMVKAYAAHFYFLTEQTWLLVPYYVAREIGTVAIAATILLGIRFGVLPWLQRPLQAVGRTAFSSYILTSVLCQLIFVWGPYPLFGKLEYYQLTLMALAIWVVNLTLSSLWLRVFAFGPLEWLWRSLTYWKPQPMLLKSSGN